MDEIGKETLYGILPIKSGERIYDFKDIFLVAAGYGIATWCYVQGAWISSVLPLYMALIATLAGVLLFAVPAFLITLVPARYGCDIWIYQRALFGYKLNLIFLLLAVAFGSGWDAVNARVFANSILLIANSMGAGWGAGCTPWLGTICILAGFAIAIKGPVAVRRTTFIIVPILFIIGVFIVVMVLVHTSFAELNAVEPVYAGDYNSISEALMYITESNFAYCLAWYACLGVLPRLVKTERANVWGHLLGMGLAMAGFICIGIISGTYMGSLGIYSEDPTEALLNIGGPYIGIISLIAIAVANISTQALEFYGFTLATKVLKPEWSYKKIITGWLMLILILTFSEKIWDYYSTFVSLGGAIYAPAISIFLVDFFIIRKQKFSLKSVYMRGEFAYQYTKGFNLIAIVAFLIGVAAYFLVFDPVQYTARSSVFFYTTATGLSFVASGISYYLIGCVPFCRRYLLKDREHRAEKREILG